MYRRAKKYRYIRKFFRKAKRVYKRYAKEKGKRSNRRRGKQYGSNQYNRQHGNVKLVKHTLVRKFAVNRLKDDSQYTLYFSVSDDIFKYNKRLQKHFETYRNFRKTGMGYKIANRVGPIWSSKSVGKYLVTVI